MTVTIPDAYMDLAERPTYAVLATVSADGTPQTSVIWWMYDGEYVIINTARGRLKDRNMTARPHVSLTIMDPDNPYRYMEIRGEIAEQDEASGVDVINQLSKRYTGNENYYTFNPGQKGQEQRVTYKIRPTRIVAHG